eukprot:6303688-Prymnesium_polylepis.3
MGTSTGIDHCSGCFEGDKAHAIHAGNGWRIELHGCARLAYDVVSRVACLPTQWPRRSRRRPRAQRRATTCASDSR